MCISDYTGTSQGRRFLVLYDLKLEVFFISTWPLWSRTLEPQKTKNGSRAKIGIAVGFAFFQDTLYQV